MAGRRICAGYYRRYDGKVVYVISTATDADTGEETVIWTSYPFADVPRYCTSSKKSFCAFVKVDGERKAKYKRQINMKISAAAIERLEDEGFRGPVRKRHRRQLDEEYDSREYQQSLTYHAYAKELCENYTFDWNKYHLCVKEKRSPPNRATSTPSTLWESCTSPARMSNRTGSRPGVISMNRRNRETSTPPSSWSTSIRRAGPMCSCRPPGCSTI